MVFDLAKDLAKGDRKSVKMKVKKEAKQIATTIGKDKAINPHVRDTINQLSIIKQQEHQTSFVG